MNSNKLSLKEDLILLIKKHDLDSQINVPDSTISEYIIESLTNLRRVIKQRESVLGTDIYSKIISSENNTNND